MTPSKKNGDKNNAGQLKQKPKKRMKNNEEESNFYLP